MELSAVVLSLINVFFCVVELSAVVLSLINVFLCVVELSVVVFFPDKRVLVFCGTIRCCAFPD